MLEEEITSIEKTIKQLKNELKFCYTENDKRIQNFSIKEYEKILENLKNQLNKNLKEEVKEIEKLDNPIKEEQYIKKFEEMIKEIEKGDVYFYISGIGKKAYETLEEAKREGDKITALPKKGGLLSGYAHYFNENGYMYSYVYNNEIKEQEKINIYKKERMK